MSDVPTDAYREILRRVPVDSLFSCRSVCKSWRNIIDDPGFAKTHFNHGIGDGWIIHRSLHGKLFLSPLTDLTYGESSISAIKLLPPSGPGIPRMRELPAPCCNGLVLISSCNEHLGRVIWNPFTGESIKLPFCDDFREIKQKVKPAIGLGYDEVGDDYKVVMVFREKKAFIWSVNSLVWRRIEDTPKACMIGVSEPNGAYANGALHWLARSDELSMNVIVALDLTTETYRNIPVPSRIERLGWTWLKFVALDGCLFIYVPHLKEQFVVWRYCGYDDNAEDKVWIKMVVSRKGDEIFGEDNLIAYLKNENRFLIHYKASRFAWYDVERDCSRDVFMDINPDLHKLYRFTLQVIPCSLIRLKRSDCNENVENSSKRKRKRADLEMLELKVHYGGAESKST